MNMGHLSNYVINDLAEVADPYNTMTSMDGGDRAKKRKHLNSDIGGINFHRKSTTTNCSKIQKE